MAKKSKKDIRKMSDEELTIEIRDARRKVYDLRSQRVTEKIEDTSQFGRMRKHVARLLTEQNSRANAKRNAEVAS